MGFEVFTWFNMEVTQCLHLPVIQRIPARDGTGQGIESQEDDEENEREETNRWGRRVELPEGMLHCLGIVEEFVARRDMIVIILMLLSTTCSRLGDRAPRIHDWQTALGWP